jgi:hypothetical protein
MGKGLYPAKEAAYKVSESTQGQGYNQIANLGPGDSENALSENTLGENTL